MIFHTFLFVVAVLLSYVRNGFGIIPVMLDYCAVFKIRFAIVFCPNRLKAVSVAVRNPLSRLSGVRPFFVSDMRCLRVSRRFRRLSQRCPSTRVAIDRHAASFPDSLLRSLPSVWKMSCRPYPQRSFPQMNNKAQHTKRAPFPTSINTADFLKFNR